MRQAIDRSRPSAHCYPAAAVRKASPRCRDRPGGRPRVCGRGSCEAVSDQELQRTIKPNMGQRGRVVAGCFEGRRTKAHEAEICPFRVSKAAECRGIRREGGVRVIRKVARKHRDFGLAVEYFAVESFAACPLCMLAGRRHAKNTRKFL